MTWWRQRPTRRRALGVGLGVVAAAIGFDRWGRGRAVAATAAGVARTALYIQPLGDTLPAADVALVRAALVALVGLDVRLLPPVALPASAFFQARRRYRAA